MKTRTIFISFVLVGALCLMVSGVWANNVRGVSDKEVKIAWLVDLSGPGRYASPMLVAGANQYAAWVNDQGGINGRKINVVVEDNGILPPTTIQAAKKVIFKDEIFAIGFNLGSSGSSAIVPLCEENQVVLMPHGANKKFYSPGNKWVFVPYPVQYSQACRVVEHILSKNPKSKIGMIYQDDGFGREGLEGALAAARLMNTKLAATAPYRIGTIDLSPQMGVMKDANVDCIVLWTYLPQTAAVIKGKIKMGWDVPLIVSGTNNVPALFKLAGEHVDGLLMVSAYVPSHTNVPGIKKMKGINQKYGNYEKELGNPMYPDHMYLASVGYLMAVIEGLRNAGRNLNPDTFVKGIENIKNFDMGGMCPNFTFGPKRHVSSFSSLILKADAKKKQFVIADPLKEPKTPQN
ncbi:ABC transporter substrate-binding protein [Thermodesulfobacteriota bacterium]